MKRLASKKSQKMFQNLFWETKQIIKREGNADWKWGNEPIDESETILCIRDMLRLAKSRAGYLERDKKLNIITAEKAELESKALLIVQKHLEERYASWKA